MSQELAVATKRDKSLSPIDTIYQAADFAYASRLYDYYGDKRIHWKLSLYDTTKALIKYNTK